jgi:hypothetical protein
MITYSTSASPDAILEADRKREFPDGSVAVLAACSTTGASLDNKLFVMNLSKLGVRAFVASPFQVDTRFGTRLATNFVAIAKDVQTSGVNGTTRLVDLFDRAIARTIESFPDPGYRDMALEFQIIGDYEMPVCKPGTPPA